MEREEIDEEPIVVEEHREDSDEELDEYEELSVKSDEKYDNGEGGRRIKPQDSNLLDCLLQCVMDHLLHVILGAQGLEHVAGLQGGVGAGGAGTERHHKTLALRAEGGEVDAPGVAVSLVPILHHQVQLLLEDA